MPRAARKGAKCLLRGATAQDSLLTGSAWTQKVPTRTAVTRPERTDMPAVRTHIPDVRSTSGKPNRLSLVAESEEQP